MSPMDPTVPSTSDERINVFHLKVQGTEQNIHRVKHHGQVGLPERGPSPQQFIRVSYASVSVDIVLDPCSFCKGNYL